MREPLAVGDELADIVKHNGFNVNPQKIRLATRHERQEVTGLTINRFPNVQRRFIRQIRAMLHAWEKHGLHCAQAEFEHKYDKRKGRRNPHPSFSRVLRGKIEFVGSIRGKADPLYWRLLRKYSQLDGNCVLEEPPEFIEYDVQELKRAVWVFMDGERQSTAFFLKDFGLVTCGHAITDRNNLHIFRSQDPLETQYPVIVRAISEELDLAILDTVDSLPMPKKELRIGDDSQIKQRDTVRLLGFPKHHQGADVSWYEGYLVHEHKVEKRRRFHISAPVIPGNSGGRC